MSDKQLSRRDFEADNLLLRLDLVIPGDVSAIDPLVDKVIWVVSELGCAKGREFEIELALRESLANAIVHGCGEDPAKQVQVCVGCDEQRGMIIVVRDPGPGFDPAQVPSPIVGECLYSEHGRGIYLINQLMDEVVHRRGGTEIHMRKR